MIKFLLSLLFFAFSATLCKGQLLLSLDDDTAHILRLERVLAQTNSDSIKAYTSLKLSTMSKLISDTARAKHYLKQGVALAEKYPFLKAASHFYLAHALYAKMDIPAIERHLLTGDSLLAAFTYPEAYKVRGYIWHAYGTFQQIKGDEKKAMDVFVNKALVYARQSKDPFLLGNINKVIGIVLLNADQRSRASVYLQQAVTGVERSTTENPSRLETLTEIYIIHAENYAYRNLLDSAKLYLDKAATILAPNPRSNLYLIYYYAEGIWFDKKARYREAIASFDKGIALATDPSSRYAANRLKYAQYKSLFNNKEYGTSVTVLRDLLKSPLVFDTDKKIYYKELYTTYALLGRMNDAYEWSEKYIRLSDSLYEKKSQSEIIELEKKYHTAENEKKITLLQAEKEKAVLTSRNNKLLAWLLGGSCLFLLAFAVLAGLYMRNSKKLSIQKELSYQQQLKEVKQQQQLQITEALLQGEERERKRLAGDLHDGLGGMLAGVKINLTRVAGHKSEELFTRDIPVIIQLLDRSVDELRRIARNMMPEALLNSGLEAALKDMCELPVPGHLAIRFHAFNLSEDIPKDMQVTIYRIVQELLANAVRHAQPSSILVQCSQNESSFSITVEDDGKGFDTKNGTMRKGIGLSNVKSRVGYLKGNLEIHSAPGEGTTVNIEFNVRA